MEKQPSSIPASETTSDVDHSFDELFESTGSSSLPESDSTDIWDEPSTPFRPAETIDTDSLWGDPVTPTSTPQLKFSGVDPFSSELFASPAPTQESGGGLFQRIRNGASRENLDSALERITEVAGNLGGMALEATVSATGIVKDKAGEFADTTREFVGDEHNQETAKRIALHAGRVAFNGALGESGLDLFNSQGNLRKGKVARVALRALRNPAGVATSAGKGIIQHGRQQAVAFGIDAAQKRFG